jgi:hypothetical protein
MDLASWAGSLNLEVPAAGLLRKLATSLPPGRKFTITVFGSAPLQILVDSTITSADVDVFSDSEQLKEIVEKAGLDERSSTFHIQVSSELSFRTSPRWRDRAQKLVVEGCTFIFPHPLDILIAKLNRLEEKDLRAFQIVYAKTGHPLEQELINELQMAVDLFRPSFDEEQGNDIAGNCRRLWPLLYGREIDPRSEIIAPALAKRQAGYGPPPEDYNQEMRDALRDR